MSLAQIISGYVFNSTRALTELATSNPERHGRRALSLVSIKNEAAATELKGVNLSLTAAYRDRNDAVKAHRFEIDYVRHHANYVPKTPEAARAHAKNIDTYDFEVAPRGRQSSIWNIGETAFRPIPGSTMLRFS